MVRPAIDVIITPGGTLLHGEFFTRLFQDTPIRRFRVDQETTRRLRIQVVPGPTYHDDVRRGLISRFLTEGDRDFEILWEILDDIPFAASGKLRYVSSHLTRTP